MSHRIQKGSTVITMDCDFEKLKQQVEGELGRPLDSEEEHYLKALLYFGRGVALKLQMASKATSEPERIGDICKRVLQDIRDRMRRQRRSRVVSAVGDFLVGRKQKPKEHRINKRSEQHESGRTDETRNF